jgi:hypothetical protein
MTTVPSLAQDLALALDPVRLATSVGLTPDAWQADVLRSTAPRLLINGCRQSGKSTTVAVLAAHTALFSPGALVLLVSRAERQSKELFRKVVGLYRQLGRPVDAETENKLELELTNGSRVVALPGKEETLRSFSGVRLLVFDEASRVLDETYKSCRPMLAVSGGRLIGLSTPWGKRGWFHQEWMEGGAGWQRVTITADDCPRIAPAFLEEERASLGPLWFASEYECAFVDTVDQVFGFEVVMGALTQDVTPLFGAD